MTNEELRLMNRPSFNACMMAFASQIAQRSTCARLQVGCVISSGDFRKVLSMGYNGNASGLQNGCDSEEPGKCGCLHAEENAIINCDSPRAIDKIVFCTDLPCVMCAKRFINLGYVRKVYFLRPYRIRDGYNILKSVGIEVEALLPDVKVSQ